MDVMVKAAVLVGMLLGEYRHMVFQNNVLTRVGKKQEETFEEISCYVLSVANQRGQSHKPVPIVKRWK